jgi:CRISPR-associated exonuclease Cas4
LTGRPDYLVERGGSLIPVEVKSSRVYETPFDEHVYQLAAYCLLVQQVYEKRPPYGILHYPDRTFEIDYTPDLEMGLLDLLAEIRRQERKDEVPRSHESPARCNKCGFRSLCDQRLK